MDKHEWQSKIGQLFVVGFMGKTMSDEVRKLIHEYRVGNFILFARNIGNGEEVLELTSALQEEAKKAGQQKPLLICTDQENGIVQRLKAPATAFPGAMALGTADDLDLAYQVGKATGLELKEVGINWNLAPVADVNNNPENPVINVRSFGESPEKVKSLMLAWMKGCQEAGVATTLKHFPGHGDTNVDSHSDLPVINYSLERLYDVELIPFIEGIKNGADSIMSAHIYFSAIEERKDVPATLSKNILTGLLRKKLGFDGVITTDCLEMNAIVKTVGVAKGAVEAIKAGVDLAMVSHTYKYQVEALEAMLEVAQNEGVSCEQIDSSLMRISKLKDKYAQLPSDKKPDESFKYFGCQEHHELALQAHRESVCVINQNENTLLKLEEDSKVLAIYPGERTHLQVEDRIYDTKIGEALSHYPAKIDHYKVDGSKVDVDECIKTLENIAEGYDHVLLFTLSFQQDTYCKVISPLSRLKNATAISLRGSFSLRLIENSDHAICVYDDSQLAIHSALDVAFGKASASGRLPVTF